MVIPILFCSRYRNRILDLGELVGENVILADFKLSAPNSVTVTLQSPPREKTIALQVSQRAIPRA